MYEIQNEIPSHKFRPEPICLPEFFQLTTGEVKRSKTIWI